MRKLKGSGNYLKNQVGKNLAKAAACLLLFFLILSAIGLRMLLTLSLNVFEGVGLIVSMAPLAAFYYFLRKYRIYRGGLAGEQQVARLLSSKLSDDYFLLNGVYLRNGGGDIDHIVLGRSGIFVLETKNWNGDITCYGDQWQRAGKQRFKGSPSIQVKRNTALIKGIIGSSQDFRMLGIRLEGIVVFTNNHTTLHLTNPTVPIVKLAQLPNLITTYQGPNMYSSQQLEAIAEEILKQKR